MWHALVRPATPFLLRRHWPSVFLHPLALAARLHCPHNGGISIAYRCQGGPACAAKFDPDDGRKAFAGIDTRRLLFVCGLLEACRWRLLVNFGARILSGAAIQGSGLSRSALLQVAKFTAFPHFCGGERLEDCIAVARRLEATASVRCIVDWSVEEREDACAWDENGRRKAETLRIAKEALGPSAAFAPVKPTALVSPALLERITLVLAVRAGEAPVGAIDLVTLLGNDDHRQLIEAISRFSLLCRAARDCGIPLLLDAEQSHRQPAVHLLVRELQREFNVGGAAVVFDTLQMYLRNSSALLELALGAAQAGGYTYAVKLVRGAYIEQERVLGTSVFAMKEETDAAYDAAVVRLLSIISAHSALPGSCDHNQDLAATLVHGVAPVMMLATHNRASLKCATSEMTRLGLARDDHRVHFAQILGMVDNLTNALGLAGYNVAKLVVFGEIRDVLPWLLRRVQENRDIFGAQASELPVLRAELRRRLFSMWGQSPTG